MTPICILLFHHYFSAGSSFLLHWRLFLETNGIRLFLFFILFFFLLFKILFYHFILITSIISVTASCFSDVSGNVLHNDWWELCQILDVITLNVKSCADSLHDR